MADNNQGSFNPSEIQQRQWEARSKEWGFRSLLEFIKAKLVADIEKSDITSLEPNDPNRELTAQRNDSFVKLDCARSRKQGFEVSVHHRVGPDLSAIVPDNLGATYDEIVRQVIDTVPGRVKNLLSHLDGDVLRNEDNGYYLQEEIAPLWGWL